MPACPSVRPWAPCTGADIVPQVFFLEASDEALVRRYSETRHRHPLDTENDGVQSAIARERQMLDEVRDMAQTTIDTTDLAFRQLRERIVAALGAQPGPEQLSLQVISFGFKYGVPLEADLVFDVRFMENPFYRPELRASSGLTEPVREFVLGQPITQQFLEHLDELLRHAHPGLPGGGQDAPHHRHRLHGRLPSLGRHRGGAGQPSWPTCTWVPSIVWHRELGEAPMTSRAATRADWARLRRWLRPGTGIKRWLLVMFLGLTILATAGALAIRIVFREVPADSLAGQLFEVIEPQLPARRAAAAGGRRRRAWPSSPSACGACWRCSWSRSRSRREPLVELVYQKRSLARGPRIVAIGGGTGLSTLLRGLKEFSSNITAIVTVADDGGSSGKLREELGHAARGRHPQLHRRPGGRRARHDTASCSTASRPRDGEPGLAGHAFGNLLIAAMVDITGDFEEGVRQANRVLAVRGQVVPAAPVALSLQRGAGRWLAPRRPVAHHALARHPARLAQPRPTWRPARRPLRPSVPPTSSSWARARSTPACCRACWCPASARPSMVAHGLRVYVANVATQLGETEGYTLSEHVAALRAHDVGHARRRRPRQRRPRRARAGGLSGRAGAHRHARRRRRGRGSCWPALVDPDNAHRHDSQRLAEALVHLLDAHRCGTAGGARAQRLSGDRRVAQARDLVEAVRAELAAIDPPRDCCRAAERAGLGDAARGRARSPVVARLAVRLADACADDAPAARAPLAAADATSTGRRRAATAGRPGCAAASWPSAR